MKSQAESLQFEHLTVREMTSQDLSQVVMIERNVHISPWARLSFEESLTKNYLCRIIENQEEIIAYSVLCPVVDELHILNVAVATQCQGAGLGHMLMQDVIGLAEQLGLRKIFLEVRASNSTAQSLYRKWQFEQISIRKRYYRLPDSNNANDREDAFVFLRQLPKQK